MRYKNTLAFAKSLDQKDDLKKYRQQFHIPVHQKKSCIYFCGNSLGLQPKNTDSYIQAELDDWKKHGVEGHFNARNPWFPYHEFLRNDLAKLVGAKPNEVVAMNSLTLNLHLMLVSFYRPTRKRRKILFEYSPFPSDRYALESHIRWHGLDPKKDLIELKPKKGEYTIPTEHTIEVINSLKDELALVMMGGVNYYTGQYYKVERITKAAHNVGALAGFDLAHAAGNKEMFLHKWNVDFAVWCSYKYLNAGPGSVAAAFIHERHIRNKDLMRFAGWWGNSPETRFTMPENFVPVASADAWQLSNAPILSMAALCASMKWFTTIGMKKLQRKSVLLTGYLEFIIHQIFQANSLNDAYRIITPVDSNQRGCQLSVIVKNNGRKLFESLTKDGVIADWRAPDVIRMAPVPLYNSFEDIYRFGIALDKALKKNK